MAQSVQYMQNKVEAKKKKRKKYETNVTIFWFIYMETNELAKTTTKTK